MMSGMRSFVKSPWAAILFLLLIISFGVFGANDPLSGLTGGSGFVSAGERSAGARDASRYLDMTLKRLQTERNETLSQKEATERGYTRQIIDDLIQRTMTLAYADKVGVKSSPREAAKLMGKMFPDGLGGINQQSYSQYLSQLGMQPKQFVKEVQDDVSYEYLQRALLAGLQPPDLMSNPIVAYVGEKRMVALARFGKDSVPKPADPTEADLRAFYTQRAAMFAQPERRSIATVMYSPADYLDKAEIKDDTVKSAYDSRIKEFSTPETRTIAQFTSSDRKSIQGVVDLAKQGKTLEAAVAATPGVTLATVTVKAADLTNADYSKAAFSWPINEVVGPIDNEGSFLGFQVKTITPGVATAFEQVSAQIRNELAQKEARRLFDASSETFHDLVGGGVSLEEISKEVGAPVIRIEAVDQRGNRKEGGPVQLLAKYPQQLAAMFQLEPGVVSDVIEGDMERGVFVVDAVVKAYTPPFEEVRDQLKPIYLAVKELEAAGKIAADAVAAVKGGQTLDAAAAKAKMTVVRPPTPLSRSQQTQIDPAIQQAIFGLKEGDITVANAQTGEPWVIQVTRIEPIKPEDEPQLAQQVKGSVGQSLAQDIMVAFSRDVRSAVKPKINDKAIQQYLDSFASEPQ